MTTEEKAKAYDEALKRAKQKIDAGFLTEDDLSYIFPELRESEDERIRKALIMLVQESLLVHQGCCKCFHEFTEEQLLAWLEKQKEQKPAEWSEEDELMCNNILNLLCSQITYVTGQGTTSGKQYPTYSKERDWFINRFKSLRPSWKPTQGQMEALLWCVAHLGGADRRVLAELYEHLKKL